MDRCSCGRELLTGDIEGKCSRCRNAENGIHIGGLLPIESDYRESEIERLENRIEELETELKRIKIYLHDDYPRTIDADGELYDDIT